VAEDGRTGRFERAVLGHGSEPDPRYSLANERTFLAWIRTSLTLLAGGVAVEAFAAGALGIVSRRVLALGLICLGMMLAAASCWRWVTLERAMRQNRPLPLNPIALVLAAGVTLAAAGLGVSVVLHG
jgi:putative membrane protein